MEEPGVIFDMCWQLVVRCMYGMCDGEHAVTSLLMMAVVLVEPVSLCPQAISILLPGNDA